MRGGTRAVVPLRRLQASANCALRTSSRSHTRRSLRSLSSSPTASTTLPAKNGTLGGQCATHATALGRRSGRAAPLRSFATQADAKADGGGPLVEYDRRVEAGELRNDEHQRGNLTHSTLAPACAGYRVTIELTYETNDRHHRKPAAPLQRAARLQRPACHTSEPRGTKAKEVGALVNIRRRLEKGRVCHRPDPRQSASRPVSLWRRRQRQDDADESLS